MPGGRRQRVATGRRPGRGHAELERQVPVGRLRWSAGESLEDVRTLARQVRVGIAVAVDVIAADAHALDPDRLPAIRGRVLAGCLARRDPPELLLAVAQVAVVVAVVADPEVPPPGPIPVAEQHRQRAPGRRQRDRGVVASAAGGRSDQLVVRAQVVRILGVGVGHVVAERQGRQARGTLPGRAERGRDRSRHRPSPTSRWPARSGNRRGRGAPRSRRSAGPSGRPSRRHPRRAGRRRSRR